MLNIIWLLVGLSLIAISIVLGALFKRLWIWFLWRQYEPLAQAIYLLNATFIYVVISRGYFPQMIMIYVLQFMPAYVIITIYPIEK